MHALDSLLKIYAVVVIVDMLLAWVQPDPRLLPRRLTHLVTEPIQQAMRLAVAPRWTAGWDLSPILVLVAIGVVRVGVLRPW